MLSDVGCVIVHHKHYPEVLKTVEAIIAQGVPPSQVVFVDNSEDSHLAARIQAELTPGIRFLTHVNLGYGHAANVGIHTLLTDLNRPGYILISTHEAIPAPNAISAMRETLRLSGADVVGPTLVSHNGPAQEIWSTGGEVSRLLNIPFHTRIEQAERYHSGKPEKRAWLDGAFCLYRGDVLSNLGFREEYFLYFEEVDLHLRIGQTGGKIMWAPATKVSQVSSGTPAYYVTRNMHLFQSLHGNRVQRAVTPIYVLLRLALRASIKERRVSVFRDMWRGFFDGRQLTKNRGAKSL